MKIVVGRLRVAAAMEQAHPGTHHTHHLLDSNRYQTSRLVRSSGCVSRSGLQPRLLMTSLGVTPLVDMEPMAACCVSPADHGLS